MHGLSRIVGAVSIMLTCCSFAAMKRPRKAIKGNRDNGNRGGGHVGDHDAAGTDNDDEDMDDDVDYYRPGEYTCFK